MDGGKQRIFYIDSLLNHVYRSEYDLVVMGSRGHGLIQEVLIGSTSRRVVKRSPKSIFLFVFAGLCEIGGGYLIWIWLRGGKSVGFAFIGAIVLVLYGIVPTFQPAHFGRVYAAYGGIFVVLSILWGWQVDHIRPDRFDLIGGLICLVGVGIIMYWPRAA